MFHVVSSLCCIQPSNMDESVVQANCVFSVIGDSNVQRNLVEYNCTGRVDMTSAQLIPCTSMSTFGACLTRVRAESNILILAILSNFLRDSEAVADPGWYSDLCYIRLKGIVFLRVCFYSPLVSRISAVYESFRATLHPYVDGNPDLHVMICPPQFSRQPSWYASALSQAVQLLNRLVVDGFGFSNLHLLPVPCSQVKIF